MPIADKPECADGEAVVVDSGIYLVGCASSRYGVYAPGSDTWQAVSAADGPGTTAHRGAALGGKISVADGSLHVLDTATSTWTESSLDVGAGAIDIDATDSHVIALDLDGAFGETVYVHDPNVGGWAEGDYVPSSDSADSLTSVVAAGARTFVLVRVIGSVGVQ